MTYNKSRTVVFVETNIFTQLVKEYLTDDEYAELQKYLMKDPEIGKLSKVAGWCQKNTMVTQGYG